MRKFFCIIISISILLTAYAYADYSDINPDMLCFDAVTKLETFGIMHGYDDNTFRPEDTLTRAEAAKLVCSAMNIQEENMSYISFYNDVPFEHWAGKYITHATALHAISGDGNQSFRPDDKVTYIEFIKMMLCILGYKDICIRNGGYPVGYFRTADSLGILENIEIADYNCFLTRGNAAIILSASLETPIYMVTGYRVSSINGEAKPVGDIMNDSGENYQTLLTYVHKIYKVDGTVVSGALKNPEEDKYEGKEAVGDTVVEHIKIDMTSPEINELIPTEKIISDTENAALKTVQYYAGNERFLNLIYFKYDSTYFLKYAFKSDYSGNIVHEYKLDIKRNENK